MTISLLGSQLEQGKTPMVEVLFREMVKNCFGDDISGLDNFVNEMGKPDEEVVAMPITDFVTRVVRLLGRPIKVAEKIGHEIQLMKNFWIAA
jgi:hypothetical protein